MIAVLTCSETKLITASTSVKDMELHTHEVEAKWKLEVAHAATQTRTKQSKKQDSCGRTLSRQSFRF